jgi:hypothetical protein
LRDDWFGELTDKNIRRGSFPSVPDLMVKAFMRRLVMRRLSGPLLMATGVLDLLYVLVFHSRQLAAIAQDGFFAAVELNPAQFDRETAFWHMMFGLMFLVLGSMVHWTQARTGTLPAFRVWSVLALGVADAILMPLSGFWLRH